MNTIKKLQSSKKNHKGFSLVELVAVIAILGVLVAILFPVYTRYIEKSRNDVDISNARTLVRSLQTYLVANPDKMAEFVAMCSESPGTWRPHYHVVGAKIVASTDKTGCLEAALVDSGIAGKRVGTGRYSAPVCQSTKNWKGYAIGFTVIDGKVVAACRGLITTDEVTLKSRKWTFFTTDTDVTPFRSLCTFPEY